jgi:glucuronoarabinoxylan endo-1,4-beta-xylanase
MRSIRLGISTLLGSAIALAPVGAALAQTATVDFTSQKQYVRGFGGMVHIPWAGDLTAAERTLVFGNADGQLGFTVLRIAVPDGSTSTSSYVATAKAAIAAGGLVYASPWNSAGNMNSADFATYADHLASFVSYMKGQGVDLYAISVQNEPDYGAQSGWRVWTAAQCHDFVLNYGDKVGTKLMSCESFNYTKSLYDPILNDSAALDKLGVLGAHLYGTPVSGFPYPNFDQKAAGKVERWMTEHYTDSNTDANSWPNALNVATELHNSMVEAQFNVYTWWYIKRSYGPINNGAITKRGYCMAHWSKFVRPGFYRVDATKSPTSGVYVSAYRSDTDVVVVVVNTSTSSKSLTLTINGTSISSYDRFTTSSSKSLANEGQVSVSSSSLSLTLDAQSVTTLHGTGSLSPTGTGGATGSGGTTSSTGSGGSARADAGRDGPGSGGAGGVVATGGTTGSGSGGMSGADAGLDARDARPVGTGGTAGAGGATSTGSGGAIVTGGTSAGAGGAPSGGNGSGGQIGSGGIATDTGGTQAGSGGASGTGGASQGGSTGVNVDTSNGCACHTGRPAGRPEALAAFLVLAMLARGLRTGPSIGRGRGKRGSGQSGRS